MFRIVQGIWWCLQHLAAINTHGCRSCWSWCSGRSPPWRNSALPRKLRRGAKFKIQNNNLHSTGYDLLLYFTYMLSWTISRCCFKISTKSFVHEAQERALITLDFEFWIPRRDGLYAVGQNPAGRAAISPNVDFWRFCSRGYWWQPKSEGITNFLV